MPPSVNGDSTNLASAEANGTEVSNAPAAAPGVADQKARALLLEKLDLIASPCVFGDNRFPKIDYAEPELVRLALGNYHITIRYFDAGWHEVTAPTADGRYGALAVSRFANSGSHTSQLTLFRVKDYSRARDPYHAHLRFPHAFGLPASIVESEAWNIDHYLDGAFNDDRNSERGYAAFLAALRDLAANPARYHGYEFLSIDNRWWDELDKRLGLAKPYPKLVRLPDGYDANSRKKWPLILFLHGSGERGSDLSTMKQWGPAAYADAGHPLPFIVVTPQCPSGLRWNPELLENLVAEMEQAHRVDSSRVYVTGLSMGGIGSLDLAAAYPGRFAALACLSGRENPAIASRLRNQPIWLFHGDKDEIVPTHDSIELAAALRRAGNPAKLTIIPDTGHGDWDKVYADPALYAWLLQHHV